MSLSNSLGIVDREGEQLAVRTEGSPHPRWHPVPHGVLDLAVHDEGDDRDGPLGVLEEIEPTGKAEQGHVGKVGQGVF